MNNLRARTHISRLFKEGKREFSRLLSIAMRFLCVIFICVAILSHFFGLLCLWSHRHGQHGHMNWNFHKHFIWNSPFMCCIICEIFMSKIKLLKISNEASSFGAKRIKIPHVHTRIVVRRDGNQFYVNNWSEIYRPILQLCQTHSHCRCWNTCANFSNCAVELRRRNAPKYFPYYRSI